MRSNMQAAAFVSYGGALGPRSSSSSGKWVVAFQTTECGRPTPGKKLGGFRGGAKLTVRARQKGANANAEAAAARAAGPCAGDHRGAGERRYLTAGHRKRSQ